MLPQVFVNPTKQRFALFDFRFRKSFVKNLRHLV